MRNWEENKYSYQHLPRGANETLRDGELTPFRNHLPPFKRSRYPHLFLPPPKSSPKIPHACHHRAAFCPHGFDVAFGTIPVVSGPGNYHPVKQRTQRTGRSRSSVPGPYVDSGTTSPWSGPLFATKNPTKKTGLNPYLMCVSKNRGTQIIHFKRVFHYKPSILGVPLVLETLYLYTTGVVSFWGVQYWRFFSIVRHVSKSQ